MLTKRTNILFEEEFFQHLVALANKKGTSVGDLVRKAAVKAYPTKVINKRLRVYNKIIKLRKGLGHISNKEIREMINYGRKY